MLGPDSLRAPASQLVTLQTGEEGEEEEEEGLCNISPSVGQNVFVGENQKKRSEDVGWEMSSVIVNKT